MFIVHLRESSGRTAKEQLKMFLERAEGPQGVKCHHTVTRKPALQLAPDPAVNCRRNATETTRRGPCLGAALLHRPERNDALHQVSRMATPRALCLNHKWAETPACFLTHRKLLSGFPLFRGLSQLPWVFVSRVTFVQKGTPRVPPGSHLYDIVSSSAHDLSKQPAARI